MTKSIDIPIALGIPPLPSQSPDTIAALLWAREVLQKHLTTSYAVTDPKGIEELKPIKIGGVDQWLHIRGRNRRNPVLLYLHGGPGSTNIGWMDAIQRPWEDFFTVVQWDQRQTGKSYYPADDEKNPLSLKQFIEDTEEVIQYLRDYLDQDKLFLLGHSWGSVLGMYIVKRHPNWLHAYIGVGQVVNWSENEQVLYKRLLNHAKEQEEDQLVEKLESIAPYLDPNNPEQSFVDHTLYVRTELSRLTGETMMHHLFLDDTLIMLKSDQILSPHLTLMDINNLLLGDDIALFRNPATIATDFVNVNLPEQLGSSFEVPIFFFTGTHDWHTPKILSDAWFDQIKAPYKELIHFQESCHVIVNEEPGKVLMALVNKVLPCAQD